MNKFEVSILAATIVGSLIYALRGQNIKQMIHLYPEEKDKPLTSKIFLRAYRIFMLIFIPGLPIYFITLKLIGVINWSWWWVLSPVFVFMIPIILILFGAVISTRKEEKKILKTCMGIYRHNVTGKYYIIEKTFNGTIVSGLGPIGQWDPDSHDITEEMLEDENLHPGLDELLIKYSGGKPIYPEFTNWLKSQQFTLCYEKEPSTEENTMKKTNENELEDKQESIESWLTYPSGHNQNEGSCDRHLAQDYEEHRLNFFYKGQHYAFVHQVLRDIFFNEPNNIIAILMSDRAIDTLTDLWYRVGKELEDNNPLRLDGLCCEVRTLENNTIVVLITLPTPHHMCEAYLVALVYRPDSTNHKGMARFIVLEHGIRPTLCEWENVDTHCNMGYRCEPNLESFFEVVRELV